MNTTQRQDLLYMLKALSDEHRLTMIGLMSQREITVSEMAQIFGLSEPTISHHVTKLHAVGFLRLRMAGNQRFYGLNPSGLAKFKTYAAQIDSLPTEEPQPAPSDNAWIDALDFTDAEKRVLRDYTYNGKITELPLKEKKWLVILRWLATQFQPGVRYTEKQVNAVLTAFHQDYATIRRSLVEYGFMRREIGGGDYWLASENDSAK